MEEDAASEIGDWEVLSAASGCGGGDDGSEVLVVSGGGGGGDVLHDHFALAPDTDTDTEAAAAAADFGGDVPASGPGDVWEALESLDGFDPVPPAPFHFVAGVSSEQLPVGGGGDHEAGEEEGSILGASVARGATWSADASGDEVEWGSNNAVISRGELRAALQPTALHAVGETPGSGAGESPRVRLDGEQIGEDAVPGDGVRGEREEQGLGGDADNAASGCGGPGGEAKDAALPGTGEGEKQVAVWWRLPLRLLHFCAWKVKPVWSLSIAAALLGLVVLGRRMYRMKRKAKGLPQIKIAFDDKTSLEKGELISDFQFLTLVSESEIFS
ncbi:hypothetical protein U9M48_023116 [Paspalum notatum var. saurae]|uniref:Uncharacterized protein n=1 Tax=Paspalum notatum var. saurae TaxID=547442 RepID=A0AAQ3WVL0_PASNO